MEEKQLSRVFMADDGHYVVVPESEIKKFYSASGYFKANPDEDDEMPYEGTGEDDGMDGDWFHDPELTMPVDFTDVIHDYEYELYWDGGNWKEQVLTSYMYDAYTDITHHFPPDYFSYVTIVYTKHENYGKTVLEKGEDGRFWLRKVSYWQGSYRDKYEELSYADAYDWYRAEHGCVDTKYFPLLETVKHCEWEMEVSMADLNKLITWDLYEDHVNGATVYKDDFDEWVENCRVRLWGHDGETYYEIKEWVGNSTTISNQNGYIEWDSQITGDDEGTHNDVVFLVERGKGELKIL